jgi:glycosyltransferase involved in cell wall biosynthesis
MTPVRALVVSHSAEPTGAPIALLRILQWCVQHALIEPTVVLRQDGELVGEFEKLGPTSLVSATMEHRVRVAFESMPLGDTALTAAKFASDHRIRRLCARRKVQVIYVNTAVESRIRAALKPLHLPVVTHVHELERELLTMVGRDGIKSVIDESDALIAVSGAVRKMLLAHGADGARIADVQEPIGHGKPVSDLDRSTARGTVFGVDDDATVVVVGCGKPSWRKGTDAFLRVAQRVVANAPADTKVVFRWIGGALPNRALSTLTEDIACLGLHDQVAVIPHRPDVDALLAAADVFISTSREDPNPLVVLEAAATGCPVVCFRSAGGAEELADAGGGKAVPYLDTNAMADAVLALIESPNERERLGKKARMIVTDGNAPQVVAEKVAAVLQRCVVSCNLSDPSLS